MPVLHRIICLAVGDAHLLHLVHAFVADSVIRALSERNEKIQIRILAYDLFGERVTLFQHLAGFLPVTGHLFDPFLMSRYMHAQNLRKENHCRKASCHDDAVFRCVGCQNIMFVVQAAVFIAGNRKTRYSRQLMHPVNGFPDFCRVTFPGNRQYQRLLPLDIVFREKQKLAARYRLCRRAVHGPPEISGGLREIQACPAACKNQLIIFLAEDLIQRCLYLRKGIQYRLKRIRLTVDFMIGQRAVFHCMIHYSVSLSNLCK